MRAPKVAIIIGAGPAGLTAAYELLKQTEISTIVVERDPSYVGGISRTVNYKGNRIDIGGHRFFSKSDLIMQWWSHILPIATTDHGNSITYQNSSRDLTDNLTHAGPDDRDDVFTVRPRKTRILYNGKFFDYPIKLSVKTAAQLGFEKTVRIVFTYVYALLFPRKPEKNLEDFFINRFGSELYKTFFKTYTEKVWGTPCTSMSAEWGAQRVKGLSVTGAIKHALRKIFRIGTLSGKHIETSLIEQFLYPVYGPGQLWEKVAKEVSAMGGQIHMGTEVSKIDLSSQNTVEGVMIKRQDGSLESLRCDYLFSTTDVRWLVSMLGDKVPANVQRTSQELEYRDFLTVGILMEDKPRNANGKPLEDTWMYIHDESVKVGRIQFFHNWQPHMAASPDHGWIGLEYFCNKDDKVWNMSDAGLIRLAKDELEKLGIAKGIGVLDGIVIRQEKAYPGYFGGYKNFGVIRKYLNAIQNLFPIGRNGMHRYNNQDHSMLSAMEAVNLVKTEQTDKERLWSINTEEEYHEERTER